MIEEIKKCIGKGFLVSKELFLMLQDMKEEEAKKILSDLMKEGKEKLLRKEERIAEIEEKEEKKEKMEEKEKKEEMEEKEKLKVRFFYAKSKKLEVKDFISHFRSRFYFFRNLLRQHSLQNLISIDKTRERKNVTIIASVLEKRQTKNKNIFLKVEDLTGTANLLVSRARQEVFEKAREVVEDDVLAFKCVSGELFFVEDIIFPDAMKKFSVGEEGHVAFISDLHVGSNKFLEEQFMKFVEWLNKENKIKYLFVLGDIIDGVGVYPGQEDELILKDVTQQYEKAYNLFEKIRKDVKIVMLPGNHDAVRLAEPQPPFDVYAYPLRKIENAILASNPCYVQIGKIEFLLYHGYSLDYYINNIDSIRLKGGYNKPELVLSFLLRHRHLAPTHASTFYMPYEKDFLTIEKVPNVFVTAHIHKSSVSSYNGITTISSSCWQAKTPFQEKCGHEPDPCKVPIMNLKNGNIFMLDFK